MKRFAPPRKGLVRQEKYKTLLVDANGLLKNSYHGAKDEYNLDGVHIGGIYQFLTTLRKLLNENVFTKIYIFWDGKLSGKLRYDYYSEYKANRNKNYIDGSIPDDESLLMQKIKVTQYLDLLNIPQITDDVVESDDLISYYVLNKEDNEEIVICTNDMDISQHIQDDVILYLLNKKVYLTKNNFKDIFNYHYSNVKLIKILCGDTSDNIKGVAGLSENKLIEFVPEIVNQNIDMCFVITRCNELQEQRKINKQQPSKVLDNVINGKTKGVQGNDLYLINEIIIDLKKPLLTEYALNNYNDIIGNENIKEVDFKLIFNKIIEDGLNYKIKNEYISDYFLPYINYIQRFNNKIK